MAIILDRLLFWISVVVLTIFAVWMSIVSLLSLHLHPDDIVVNFENYQGEFHKESY